VLFILILTGAWLAVVLFGLTLCRLATLSDQSDAVALAEWVATREIAEPHVGSSGSPAEQPASETRRGAHRATG
jgi:hypothetical protein